MLVLQRPRGHQRTQCHCPLLRALIPQDCFPISVSLVIISAIFSSLPVSPPSASPHPSLSYPSCKSLLVLEIRVSSLEFQRLWNHPLKVQAHPYITTAPERPHTLQVAPTPLPKTGSEVQIRKYKTKYLPDVRIWEAFIYHFMLLLDMKKSW